MLYKKNFIVLNCKEIRINTILSNYSFISKELDKFKVV